MNVKNTPKPKDSKETMNTAVGRVEGAVRVANASVSETMKIKDEALDDVEKSRTNTNSVLGNISTNKIKKDTDKLTAKK